MKAAAAGYGWSNNGSGGMDLLSAVTRELGHVLGFDRDYGGRVMGSTLDVSQRLVQSNVRQELSSNLDKLYSGTDTSSLTTFAMRGTQNNRTGLNRGFARGPLFESFPRRRTSPTADGLVMNRQDELAVRGLLAQSIASRYQLNVDSTPTTRSSRIGWIARRKPSGLAWILRCSRLFPSRSSKQRYIFLVCRSTPQ